MSQAENSDLQGADYSSIERNQLERDPHIALRRQNSGPDQKWYVSLSWGEGSGLGSASYKVDLAKWFPEDPARKEAIKRGMILNLPVAKYDDADMETLWTPESPSTPEQISAVEKLKNS